MKIYQWWNGSVPGDGYARFRNSERKTNSYIFMEGKPLPFDSGLPNWKETLQDPKDYDLLYTYFYDEKKLKSYACMPNNGQAPLVNQKVLDILLDLCPDEFQYFPVTIVGENPKHPPFENHDYFLINICQTVDGIDKFQTDLQYLDKDLGGAAYGIEGDLFLKAKLPYFNMARDETLASHIYVAEPLVKAFKKAKINGVKFELLGETTFVE